MPIGKQLDLLADFEKAGSREEALQVARKQSETESREKTGSASSVNPDDKLAAYWRKVDAGRPIVRTEPEKENQIRETTDRTGKTAESPRSPVKNIGLEDEDFSPPDPWGDLGNRRPE